MKPKWFGQKRTYFGEAIWTQSRLVETEPKRYMRLHSKTLAMLKPVQDILNFFPLSFMKIKTKNSLQLWCKYDYDWEQMNQMKAALSFQFHSILNWNFNVTFNTWKVAVSMISGTICSESESSGSSSRERDLAEVFGEW